MNIEKSENGFAFRGVLFLIVLIAIAAGILYYAFGQVIPPGWMGVRQVTLGPGQGYHARALRAGYHWSIPFYSRIHLVPSIVQVLDFHQGSNPGPLQIKTTDGADVDVDITLLSRFFLEPGEFDSRHHGGPADLLKNVGTTQDRWKNQVIGIANDEIKQGLSGLMAGQFYNPHLREKALKTAHERMNERLEPFGIHIEGILLRRYSYRDSRIDDAIFNKNLQDQEKALKEVEAKLAEVRATLEQEAAEWDAKIRSLQVEGDNTVNVLLSEGNLTETQKIAEGDLLLAKAQAEVDRLKAQALSQSAGADVFVARELAPIIASLKGGVISNLDPYDFKVWAEKLGVEKK